MDLLSLPRADGVIRLAAALAVCAAVYTVVGAIFTAVRVWLEQRRVKRRLSGLRGPPERFVFGNAAEKSRNGSRLHDWITENFDTYCSPDGPQCYKLVGPAFFRSLGGSANEIVTRDPENVKYVLQTSFTHYNKSTLEGRFMIQSFVEWLGNGIFAVDHGTGSRYPRDRGVSWQLQRRTASGIFTRSLFQSFYMNVFVSHGRRLIEQLGKRASSGVPLDIQAFMFQYTMDAFGEIALGYDMGCLSGEDGSFGAAFDGAHSCLLKHVGTKVRFLLLRELLPWPMAGAFEWTLQKVCSFHRAFRRHVKVLDAHTYRIIDAAAKDPKLSERQDLLALFMHLKDEDTWKPVYSRRMLRDVVLSFIIAGRDTTACTLSWIWYELSRAGHEQKLEAAQAEVDQVLQGEEPTFALLQEMPYLRGVVWEALRLHPIVPYTSLFCDVDNTLPDGTFVPQGTRVSYSTFAMGRSERLWGADAAEFRPERWIPFSQPSQYDFPVFKGGPRLCLGKDMALLEAMTAAAMVLQSFTPRLAGKADDHTYSRKVTLSVYDKGAQVDRLMVTLEPRASRSNSPS